MIRLVRSEVRKLLTTRLWWGLLIGVVAASIALALLVSLTAGLRTNGGVASPGVEAPTTVRSTYTAGLGIVYLLALALGVITMAGEYRHQTVTATVLATPKRARIVVAKLLALSVVGAGYGVATVATGIAAGLPVILARGGSARLTTDGVPRTLLLAVLAVVLWTFVGLGVGTLIRNQVVALLLSIGIAWIAEPLISFGLNAAHAGRIAEYLPTQATNALVVPATNSGGFSIALLPWWGGAMTLAAYALVAGGLGVGLTLRRDVT